MVICIFYIILCAMLSSTVVTFLNYLMLFKTLDMCFSINFLLLLFPVSCFFILRAQCCLTSVCDWFPQLSCINMTVLAYLWWWHVGLAVVSGICSSLSVTICKDAGHYHVTETAAHELGHKWVDILIISSSLVTAVIDTLLCMRSSPCGSAKTQHLSKSFY